MLAATLHGLVPDAAHRLRMAALWPAFITLQVAAAAQAQRTAELDQAVRANATPSFIAHCEAAEREAIEAATNQRDILLASQNAGPRDVALKLLVLIATGQPGVGSSQEFPWAELHILLRELIDI